MLIAAAVILVLLVFFIVAMYNGLVSLKVQCDNAWSDIDVQLKRRYDLIPNLIETVKGYAAHEKGKLEGVVAARNRAIRSEGPAAKAGSGRGLTAALRQSVRWPRRTPQLRPWKAISPGHAQSKRRQHSECPPLLQRSRPRPEYENRAVPFQHHRRHVQFQAARIFRTQRAC
jgi:hypothetical protein